VKNDWISILWGNPHRTAGAVLLKMALILTPQINVFASGESLEFF
jgi:hypothetical protein